MPWSCSAGLSSALLLACRLNLASFVTTWMEPEAKELMTDALNVNYIDMGGWQGLGSKMPNRQHANLSSNLFQV